MEAVEFLKTRARMCIDLSCEKCPLKFFCETTFMRQGTNAAKAVSVAELWAKEHPIKTRQSEFLKMFPNAQTDDNGVVNICSRAVDAKNGDETVVVCIPRDREDCKQCRRDFWLKEIE